MYKNELKQIKELTEGLSSLLEDTQSIIAGGAVTSIFTNSEINDIDVYFRSKEMFSAFLAGVLSRELDINYMTITHVSDRSILMTDHNDLKVQLIYYKFFDSPEKIFEDFDFSVNMGAYDCKSGEFILHDSFMKHNAQRYIDINVNTAFPLISVLRVDKYRKKGYEVSKAQMLSLLLRITQLELNGWDETISACGGMYGIDPKDLFDQTKEFSIGEVITQLQSLPKHLAMMKEGSGFKHHVIYEEEHYTKLENSVVEDVMTKFKYHYNYFGENTPVKDWDEIYDELIPEIDIQNSEYRIDYKHFLM